MVEKRYIKNPAVKLIIWPYKQTIEKEPLYQDDTDVNITVGTEKAFYFDEDPSDITDYLSMLRGSPDNDTPGEAYIKLPSESTASWHLLEQFAYKFTTDETIPAGKWTLKLVYAADTPGGAPMKYSIYKRTIGGTETLLFEHQFGDTWNTNGQIDAEIETKTITQSFSFSAGEYLVVKVYVKSRTDYSVEYWLYYGTSSYDSGLYPPVRAEYTVYQNTITDIDFPAVETQIDSILNATINEGDIDIYLKINDNVINSILNWSPATYGAFEDITLANKESMSGGGVLKVTIIMKKIGQTFQANYWNYKRFHYYGKNPVTPADFNCSVLQLMEYSASTSFLVVLNDDLSEFINESVTNETIRSVQPRCTKVEVLSGTPTLIFKGW
ncbi:hypothetical protein DRJ17_05980 [Candidatus Woesearchaeota archaeon]|nr:MAG: hypothetical protein DRJ17_05980 [Candidatus Woesearchaeota archaeon]